MNVFYVTGGVFKIPILQTFMPAQIWLIDVKGKENKFPLDCEIPIIKSV